GRGGGGERETEPGLPTVVQRGGGAPLARDDRFVVGPAASKIVALAARYEIPASYSASTVVRAGGLMSYGVNSSEQVRTAGRYIGRILKGDKPADLPVLQPTKFEFAINIKTAKALGLKIPESFLLRADVVIE